MWFDMLSGNVSGLDSVRSDLEAQGARLTNIHFQIIATEDHADKTVGCAFSTQRITGDGRDGAPKSATDLRQTDCFVKVFGKSTLVPRPLSVQFAPATCESILAVK